MSASSLPNLGLSGFDVKFKNVRLDRARAFSFAFWGVHEYVSFTLSQLNLRKYIKMYHNCLWHVQRFSSHSERVYHDENNESYYRQGRLRSKSLRWRNHSKVKKKSLGNWRKRCFREDDELGIYRFSFGLFFYFFWSNCSCLLRLCARLVLEMPSYF